METLTADPLIAHAGRLRTVIALAAMAVFLQSPSMSQNSTFLLGTNDREAALPVDPSGGAPDETQLGVLPATFSGDFACSGCAGIHYQLNLFPDHVFLSRMVYQGDKNTVDDVGTWEVTKDGKALVLNGRHGAVEKFEIREEGTLRELQGGSHGPASKSTNDLHRSEKFFSLDSGVTLRGMYVYFADSGLFRECVTGKRWPVAPEKDNPALQSAYLKARQKPKQELLVTIKGRLAPQPRMEGEGTQTVLVVEKFLKVSPGGTCRDHAAPVSLEGVTWDLTHLGSKAVVHKPGSEAPNILLDSEGNHLSGFAGCNRIIGGYELKGDTLDFTGVATTMMFCTDNMDAEGAFISALRKVETWKITGQGLNLFDGEGKSVARFTARASE